MKWAWVALLLAGCSSEAVEVGQDAASEVGPDAAVEAAIDSGHDSPETDSKSEMHEASVEAAPDTAPEAQNDAVSESEAAAECVPVYTKTDSVSGSYEAGTYVLKVDLECEPGETTPLDHWIGECETDGKFADPCQCSHVGTSGVHCSVMGEGTLTVTAWCARDCDQ